MASIPQINNPISGKGIMSGMSGRSTNSESEEQFDLIQLADPLEVRKTGERESGNKTMTGGQQKDFMSMSVKIAKDPTMAVESLKQLINEELMSIAKSNGYTELYGELDSLMKELYLTADNLVSDIVMQERQNTIFSNSPFFDILREIIANTTSGHFNSETFSSGQLAKPNNSNNNLNNLQDTVGLNMNTENEELKTSVGNVLKAINHMVNKNEILKALSANTKFLSQYFTPNKNLSENLFELSNAWNSSDAPKNFETLKNQTMYILKNVSESLLNNEQTQVLIPLIIHNLSRYNTNDDMLTDYLAQLLTQIPNNNTKERLINAFEKFVSSFFNKQDNSQNLQNSMNTSNSAYTQSNNTNNTTSSEINQPLNSHFLQNRQIPEFLAVRLSDEDYVKLLNFTAEDLETPLRNYLLDKTDGMTAIRETLNLLIHETGIKNILSGELKQLTNIGALVDYLNEILQILPDNQARSIIYNNLVEIINNMAETEELPATDDEIQQNANRTSSVDDEMQRNTNNTSIDDEIQKNNRNFTTDGEANKTEADVRENKNPSNSRETNINGNKPSDVDGDDLDNNNLNRNRNAPDSEQAERGYVNRNETGSVREKNNTEFSVDRNSVQNQGQNKEETSLKGLIDFVDKNIDHSALKSINNYNASNLLQSLINAPGVFTPLAHYIIPLQIEDTKAFGELWVDKDEENGTQGSFKKRYHLFLTFEVEAIGRFEIDMYALGEDVNISFMHPAGFQERTNEIIKKVNRVIAQSGYVTRNFKSAPLTKPHNLTEIFPHINEKRSGFNVKA